MTVNLGHGKVKLFPLLISILIGIIIVASGCSSMTPTAPAPAPTQISRDDAWVTVLQRLNNLAQTPEAKEYVSLFFMDYNFGTEQEVIKGKKAWEVRISHRSGQSYDLIQNAPWFHANWDYFRETHWEDEIVWVVWDDGIVEPFLGAALIESDIQQLNTNRVLK